MKLDMSGYDKKLVLVPDTVTISADEYHKLQVIADIARRDYLAITASPGTEDAAKASLAIASTAELCAAVEALDE